MLVCLYSFVLLVFSYVCYKTWFVYDVHFPLIFHTYLFSVWNCCLSLLTYVVVVVVVVGFFLELVDLAAGLGGREFSSVQFREPGDRRRIGMYVSYMHWWRKGVI